MFENWEPTLVAAQARVAAMRHGRLHAYERLVSPLPLPVHDWRITGLDVNRGYSVAEVSRPEFIDMAAAPAAAL